MLIELRNRSASQIDKTNSKSIKLKEFNFNYPTCENLSNTGYDLISRNNGNIIKIQHSLYKCKKEKTNMAIVNIPSKWVKANVNVFENDVCVIQNEGKIEPNSVDETKMEWHFDISLPNGEIKDCKFNKASLVNFIEKFGKESKDWVGKEIVAAKIINYPKGAGIVWEAK